MELKDLLPIFGIIIILIVAGGILVVSNYLSYTTPEKIAEENKVVQAFMKSHVGEQITTTHFEREEFQEASEEIKKECGQYPEGETETYRVKISDPESGEYLIVWIDWQEKEILCGPILIEELSEEDEKGSGEGGEVDQGEETGQEESADENEEIPETCTPGFLCKDNSTKAYKNIDCSLSNETICEFGCENEECNLDSCEGISCGDYCNESTRFYNGECTNGVCGYTALECQNGCVGGVCMGDPCAGITCQDICEGNNRRYDRTCQDGQCSGGYLTNCQYGCVDGECINPCIGINCTDKCEGTIRYYDGSCNGGQCQYSTQQCQYGCTNGDCLGDPCAGVTCPDICEGNTRKYTGQCIGGNCSYTTQICQHGCTNGQCKPNPLSCISDWPQIITNEGGYLYGCVPWHMYCKAGTTECCDWSQAEGHHACINCANGGCVEAACIKIDCSGFCENGVQYYYGTCNGGICSYPNHVPCASGICQTNELFCDNDQSTIAIFVTTNTFDGGLGTVTGADAKCQAAAIAAGRTGTWKALISGNGISAKDRIPEGVYKTMKGEVIATSKADLFDGEITNKIRWSEYGDDIGSLPDPKVWTGTFYDGTEFSHNCDNWVYNGPNTDSAMGLVGTASISLNTPDDWLTWTYESCDDYYRLYCFQYSR